MTAERSTTVLSNYVSVQCTSRSRAETSRDLRVTLLRNQYLGAYMRVRAMRVLHGSAAS